MNNFTRSYILAALWLSTDDAGTPLDSNYSESDIAPESLASIVADCSKFQAKYGHLFTSDNCTHTGCPVEEYAGHDFWLTRNGHGCGFWDGDWIEPASSELTKAAKSFGQCNLYIGNDGKVWCE